MKRQSGLFPLALPPIKSFAALRMTAIKWSSLFLFLLPSLSKDEMRVVAPALVVMLSTAKHLTRQAVKLLLSVTWSLEGHGYV